MLERLVTLKCQGIDFAFESTLAARHFARFLRDCRSSGYRLNLIYFWLQSPELALERVHRRVASGGHRKFGSETPSFYDGFTVKY